MYRHTLLPALLPSNLFWCALIGINTSSLLSSDFLNQYRLRELLSQLYLSENTYILISSLEGILFLLSPMSSSAH